MSAVLQRVDGQWIASKVPAIVAEFRVSLVLPESQQPLVVATQLLADIHTEAQLCCQQTEHYTIARLDLSGIGHEAEAAVRSNLHRSEVDYLIWPEPQITPLLMVFDMDSTFIQIEVIDELARRAGVGEQVAAVTEQAMRGELDFAESLRHRVACLRGLDATVIDEIAETLPLSPGVDELVQRANACGVKSAIVSGGFRPFVESLAEKLPLFSTKANELEIIDGLLTGQVLGEIVDAEMKATFLRHLCQQLKLSTSQVIAIGDGANDLKMMAEAGFSLAYRAKPKVQQAANGRFNYAELDCLADIFNWR